MMLTSNCMQSLYQTAKPLINVISCLTCFILGLRYVDDLNNLVNCYHSIMDSLSEAKFIMLAKQIKTVQKEMHFGCKRLNWNSLGMVHTEAEMSV